MTALAVIPPARRVDMTRGGLLCVTSPVLHRLFRFSPDIEITAMYFDVEMQCVFLEIHGDEMPKKIDNEVDFVGLRIESSRGIMGHLEMVHWTHVPKKRWLLFAAENEEAV